MLAALVLARALAAEPATLERRVAAMGTTLDIAVAADSREKALAASETIVAEVRRVEDLLTTWRDSPLRRLNLARVGEEIPLDAELADVLAEVLAWAARTGRAFDPTVAPLTAAWDLRGSGRIPKPEELAEALAATGPARFRIDARHASAARLNAGAGFDEGGWGKGYALDRAGRRLAAEGVGNALVDLGGQVLALGRQGSGRAWEIGIAHPRDREKAVVTLALSNLSASTSGNSERGKTVGGRRIGHELDPHRGEPAPDFGSVTVVGPSGLVTDILSTAFFVLGPEQGLELSRRLRHEGMAQEVLFLIDRGAVLDAVSSPGLARIILSADPSVHGLTNRPHPSP